MQIDIKTIATGVAKEYKRGDKDFKSAYKKDIFYNSVYVNTLGLENDTQVDKRFHGGVDKAIHIGSIIHHDKNKEFDKLFIGANILIDTYDENEIFVGDIYKIGEVRVEVTQPRQPCWKIGVLFGKEANRYIVKNHATGWYVRVLKEGTININDKMVLEKRVSNVSIKNLSIYLKTPPTDKSLIEDILNIDSLANSYKKDFLKAVSKKQ